MAKKLPNGRYECTFCHKDFETVAKADGCEMAHQIIYVPIKKEDLMRLIQFLYTREEKLLTDSLVNTLTKYARAKTEKDIDDLPSL